MKEILKPLEGILKNSKQSIVKKAEARLDIVSREEFEVQKKILNKTRQKLDELEKKLDAILESQK